MANADLALAAEDDAVLAIEPAAQPADDRIVEHLFVGTPRYAPVRVFPAPTYTGAFAGVRSDFRETVHWAPRALER